MAQPGDQPVGPTVLDRAGTESRRDRQAHVLDQLGDRYAVRRPEEVTAFLRAYPHLGPLRIEAAEVVPRYFEPDAPLVLEVVTDPEADGLPPELFALVQTTLNPDEALARLDRLDDDWWLDVSPDGPGTLVVSLEYR